MSDRYNMAARLGAISALTVGLPTWDEEIGLRIDSPQRTVCDDVIRDVLEDERVIQDEVILRTVASWDFGGPYWNVNYVPDIGNTPVHITRESPRGQGKAKRTKGAFGKRKFPRA